VTICCAVPAKDIQLVSFIFLGQRWFFGIAVQVEEFKDLKKALMESGYSESAVAKIVDCYAQFLKC
jgi:hypothetical protein